MRGSESKHSLKKHSSVLVWIVSEMLEMASAIEDAETAPRGRLRASQLCAPKHPPSSLCILLLCARVPLRPCPFSACSWAPFPLCAPPTKIESHFLCFETTCPFAPSAPMIALHPCLTSPSLPPSLPACAPRAPPPTRNKP